MKNTLIIVGLAVILVGGYFLWPTKFTATDGAGEAVPISLQPTDRAIVREGKKIYAANCAACHGANLEGEQDWRVRKPSGRLPAPPHDASGHTWHHPDEMLFYQTKFGLGAVIGDASYESDMPVYNGLLTDEEIIAALSYIKSTWPDDIRAKHDQLNATYADR